MPGRPRGSPSRTPSDEPRPNASLDRRPPPGTPSIALVAADRRRATRSSGRAASAASPRRSWRPASGRRCTSTTSTSSSARSAALRAVLPPVVDLAYAVKANPALAVVAHLGRLGTRRRRRLGRRAGDGAPGRHRPGPDRHDRPGQARRRAAGGRRPPAIRAVTVESPGELGAARGDRRRGRPPRAGDAARRGDRGRPARTGPARRRRRRRQVRDGRRPTWSPRRDAPRDRPHLELLGLHAFGASNVLDAAALVDHVAATVRAARQLAALAGTTVRLVDAGGGLGIPYEAHEESLDLARLRPWRHRDRGRLAGRPAPRRRAAAARARALPRRAGRRVRRARRRPQDASTARRSSSSTAASTTCCGRPSSARSTGSGAVRTGRIGLERRGSDR